MAEYYGRNINDQEKRLNIQKIKEHLYTDWDIYHGIVFHLISNAIKFSNKEQTIEINIRFVEKDHDKIVYNARPLAF